MTSRRQRALSTRSTKSKTSDDGRSRSPSPSAHRPTASTSSGAYFNQYTEPLINRVDNAWLDEKNLAHDNYDDNDDDDYHGHRRRDEEEYPDICDIDNPTPARVLERLWVRSLALRKSLSLILLIYLTIELIHAIWISPWTLEDRLLRVGLEKDIGGYGVQSPSQIVEIIHSAPLDTIFMPGGEHDPEGKRRLVFIGDIHGCSEDLDRLLKAVEFDSTKDHLVHTGDVVAKGPDSAAVLDTLISMNASGVRGNWEDRVLTAAQFLFAQQRARPVQPYVDEMLRTHRQPSKEAEVLARLTPEHIKYLKTLPLILTIGPPTPPDAVRPPSRPSLPKFSSRRTHDSHDPAPYHSRLKRPIKSPVLVAHAGIVPAVPLIRQDPISVMTMRYIHPANHIPTARNMFGSVRWTRVWTWYQRRLVRGIPLPTEAVLSEEMPPTRRLTTLGWLTEEPPVKKPRVAVLGSGAEDWKTVTPEGKERDVGLLREWADALGLSRRKKKHSTDPWDIPTAVVYGHNAHDGVRLDEWTLGLDGGCVQGGRLVALVVDAWGRCEVVSVGCKDHMAGKTVEVPLDLSQ